VDYGIGTMPWHISFDQAQDGLIYLSFCVAKMGYAILGR
jgi:hypothetical protein